MKRMDRTVWPLAMAAFALAVAMPARAAQTPEEQFKAALPGAWEKGKTSQGATRWKADSAEAAEAMIACSGVEDRESRLSPADQLQQWIGKHSADFPGAANFARAPFPAAGPKSELLQFSLKHAQDGIDAMKSDDRYKSHDARIDAMSSEVKQMQDVLAKNDPTLMDKAQAKVVAWWNELKGWSNDKQKSM